MMEDDIMAERNLNFDQVVNRKNTNSLKYDCALRRGMPEDVLPLWVADMDFKVSSYIEDAIVGQATHAIYGYSEPGDGYLEALKQWLYKQHKWKIENEWVIKTPGIVFALALAVKAFTKENDAVLIQQPVYYPFSEVILDNNRRLISNTLIQNEDGTYEIDFEDFENKIQKEKIKLFFLCNPHNPVGRVWTKEELLKIGEICKQYNVIVVSDEIHSDFVFRGKHEVFANLTKDFASFTITCTSPSKTFNIAGLQVSNIIISNATLRRQLRIQLAASGYSQLNSVGLVACEAAYRYGEEWYLAVKQYIKSNIEFVKDYIKKYLKDLKMIEPEGTYLVWIDFRALNLSAAKLDDLIINKAGIWLDSGRIFSKAGEGFQRINVACPRTILEEALNRIRFAIYDSSET